MTYKHKDRYCVGIDPGRNMGYAFVGSGCWWETIDLGPHDGRQLAKLARHLRESLDASEGQVLVCYEEPAMLRGHALIQIQRQLGVIMATLEELGIPHYPVNQSTLKSWVGKMYWHQGGRPDKDAMMQAARDEGAPVKDHNEADAYWLARYGQEVVWDQVF
jgi:hypothetical protein